MLNDYSGTLWTGTPRTKIEVKVCVVKCKTSIQTQTSSTIMTPIVGFLPYNLFRTNNSSLWFCLSTIVWIISIKWCSLSFRISRSLNVRWSVGLLCDTDLWIIIQLQMAVPSIMYHIVHFFCSSRYFNIWIFRPTPVVDTSSNGLPLQTDPEVPFPAPCKFQMPRHTLYCICASHMMLCQIWQLSGIYILL